MEVSKEDVCTRNIVVTGFGLFRDHESNPSWEAIRDEKLKIKDPRFKIVTRRIDVSYEAVDQVIPELWKEYNPVLMVHVGLAAHDENIRFELFARHGPYIHDDINKHAPHEDLRNYEESCQSLEENVHKRNYSCKPCSFDCDSTCLDVERICERMNQAYEEGELVIPTRKSLEAGLYVCEYIYHKSLRISDRCIFIHVPNVGLYKLDDITKALNFALNCIIENISQENAQI